MMEPTMMEPTICVNCKHHKEDSSAVPEHAHHCHALFPSTADFVTGERKEKCYCHEENRDGRCRWYEAATDKPDDDPEDGRCRS